MECVWHELERPSRQDCCRQFHRGLPQQGELSGDVVVSQIVGVAVSPVMLCFRFQ